MCLIEQNQIAASQKFLEAELLYDPDNQEARDILSQVIEATTARKSRLLVGPVPYQKLVDCITSEASREENDRNLYILIQSSEPRGEYLGQFEQECNKVIADKDAWSYVKLLRGRMPEALEVYKLAGSDRLGD